MFISYAVFCLKKIFFNYTATTEIYTIHCSSAASDVYKRQDLFTVPETCVVGYNLSLIHISEPTRPVCSSRMPSSA